LRTRASALLFAGFLAAVARAAPALASDVGPVAAVATIRHDLPLLLAAQFEYFDVRTKPTVDWVVTDGHDAVATWRAAERRGIVNLRLHSGRWWWRAAAVKTTDNSEAPWTRMRTPGIDLEDCDSLTFPDPPSANSLLADGFIGKAMAREVSSRLPATHTPNIAGGATCNPDDQYLVSTTGGSEATFIHHEEYLPSWFNWIGRTEADRGVETAGIPDPLYSFSLTARRDNGESGMQRLVHSTLKLFFDELLPTPPPTLAFSRNLTIDVWFPYVLAKQDHYALSISNVTPEIAGVPGTLNNNVLHFVLPAFTLQWGDVARGEIDGALVEPSSTPAPCLPTQYAFPLKAGLFTLFISSGIYERQTDVKPEFSEFAFYDTTNPSPLFKLAEGGGSYDLKNFAKTCMNGRYAWRADDGPSGTVIMGEPGSLVAVSWSDLSGDRLSRARAIISSMNVNFGTEC
jgi:hypothetical protein